MTMNTSRNNLPAGFLIRTCQCQAHHADKACHPPAWAGDFNDNRLDPDCDEQEHNVGIGDDQQEFLDQRNVDVLKLALAVWSVTVSPATSTVKPSSWLRRSFKSVAMKSISPASNASSEETAVAFRMYPPPRPGLQHRASG